MYNNEDIPRLEAEEKIKLDIDFENVNIKKKRGYPFFLVFMGIYRVKRHQLPEPSLMRRSLFDRRSRHNLPRVLPALLVILWGFTVSNAIYSTQITS